jgi:hypothetical protein
VLQSSKTITGNCCGTLGQTGNCWVLLGVAGSAAVTDQRERVPNPFLNLWEEGSFITWRYNSGIKLSTFSITEAILERERVASTRTAWGKARIAFRANRLAIKELLDADWPLTTIYQQAQDSLAGVSYSQFTFLVRKNFPSISQRRGGNDKPSSQSIASTEMSSDIRSPIQREAAKNDKPSAPGSPAKFKPGPRLPDPKLLY